MTDARPLLPLAAALALGLVAPAAAPAEPAEPSTAFFDEARVHELVLTLAPADLAELEATAPRRRRPPPPGGPGGPGGEGAGRGGPPPEGPTDDDFLYVPASLSIDGAAPLSIAARWKGNSSFQWARGHGKKSWKLDFDRVVKDQAFLGLTKLNLQNGAMDSTLMRESVAYELYRAFGVPAPRTTFARVELALGGGGRRPLGVYTVVEQVDAAFLRRAFGEDRGLLVKPERAGDLRLRPGEDAEALAERLGVKREGRAEDRAALHELVALLSLEVEGRPDDFERRLAARLDLEAFLRWWALATLLGDVDTLAGMGHNAYLYVRPADGRVTLIPWDLNHAFGGMPGTPVEQAVHWSIDRPFTGSKRLFEHVLASAALQARFRALLTEALESLYSRPRVADLVERRRAALAPRFAEPEARLAAERWAAALSDDVDRTLPFGPPGGPAGGPPAGPPGGRPGGARREPGLLSFVERRAASVREQLAGTRVGVRIEGGPPGGVR